MTIWFDRNPGEIVSICKDEEDLSDVKMLIIGNIDVGDWLRTPPELGSEELRVKSVFSAPCPMCYRDSRDESPTSTYDFEESSFLVSECLQGHGFVWYQLREKQ